MHCLMLLAFDAISLIILDARDTYIRADCMITLHLNYFCTCVIFVALDNCVRASLD